MATCFQGTCCFSPASCLGCYWRANRHKAIPAIGPSLLALVFFVAGLLVFGLGLGLWAVFPTLLADVLPYLGPLRLRLRRVRRPRPRLRRRARAARAPSIDE